MVTVRGLFIEDVIGVNTTVQATTEETGKGGERREEREGRGERRGRRKEVREEGGERGEERRAGPYPGGVRGVRSNPPIAMNSFSAHHNYFA